MLTATPRLLDLLALEAPELTKLEFTIAPCPCQIHRHFKRNQFPFLPPFCMTSLGRFACPIRLCYDSEWVLMKPGTHSQHHGPTTRNLEAA